MCSENKNIKLNKSLKGDRLDLIPFKEEFITEKYLDWLSDIEVTKYLDVSNYDQTIDTITNYINRFNNSENYIFAIVIKEINNHIGNITLQNINWVHKFATEGIMIGDKKYWKDGYGTEARSLLIEFAFNDLKLNRIVSSAFVDNLAGIKSNAKLGYKKEGIFRNHMILEGQYSDVIQQGILKEDFMPYKNFEISL
ncbi:MAG: GNAT family N-acetyltransferase [Dehalococcoidia bacterium]